SGAPTPRGVATPPAARLPPVARDRDERAARRTAPGPARGTPHPRARPPAPPGGRLLPRDLPLPPPRLPPRRPPRPLRPHHHPLPPHPRPAQPLAPRRLRRGLALPRRRSTPALLDRGRGAGSGRDAGGIGTRRAVRGGGSGRVLAGGPDDGGVQPRGVHGGAGVRARGLRDARRGGLGTAAAHGDHRDPDGAAITISAVLLDGAPFPNVTGVR